MEREPNILMGRYELGRLLGIGMFAKVYNARSLTTGESVAIKAMDKQKILKVGMTKQIKREISVMRLVRHPNIVRLYEVMATKSKIYIVMEYVKGGELFNRVAQKKKLKEEEARKYFQQLISAVDFCHSRGVYHRDLKPENLLLDDNGDIKVCDFGLSALPDQFRQDGLLHTACGTPNYVAPEVIKLKGYDGAKADIWSCGVILFVLLAGYLPFHDANLLALYKKICNGEFKFPPWFSSDVRQLILRLLDPNPSSRIIVPQLMEVPWFRRGFKPSQPNKDVDVDVGLHDDIDTGFFVPKPAHLNAFDIISLSPAFNLSGLFEDKIVKQELWFTSTQPASSIISKLEEIARALRFSVKKSEDCKVKLQGSEEGRKGYLSLDAEISEVTPSLFIVELRKTGGDTLEYSKLCSEEIRPGLKDIVWIWDGNSQ
jgi:5'-AMP-activated protein kinase catalytic alpha subunit